jgi:diguanylate cyclase (GGDEF)-like protein
LRLVRRASFDELTGVLTRSAFQQQFGYRLAECAASSEPISVLVVDVDHFKWVNDAFGHGHGDRVLGAVAQRVLGCVRECDIVGRVGGEEFAAILPGTGLAEALRVGERVRRAVEDGAEVTASIGVVTADARNTDADILLAAADAQMYAAKAAGRNAVRGQALPTDPGAPAR